MMTSTMTAAAVNDAELVAKSLSGNRDAFGQIVARYQSLICSLAYSATGSLSRSEDLAQETFVTVWKQLPSLREPEKLRPWLCRISRNLIYDELRKQGREPSHHGEPLEELSESHSPEPLPIERAISNEEQTILWRSLERIPEIYRESLVLFYREHQSIETVAASLELSEDAVKQRLSRGRKLLQEQVLAFVEGALQKTSPGKTFTVSVLAALALIPTSAKAAAIGTTSAKVSTAAKTGMTVASVIVYLPIIGSLYLTMKANLEGSKSPRERHFSVCFNWILFISFFGLLTLQIGFLTHHSFLKNKFAIWAIIFSVQLIFISGLGLYSKQRRRQIRIEDGTYVAMTSERRKEFFKNVSQHGSKRNVYLYLSLACCMLADLMMELKHLRDGRGHILFSLFLLIFTMFLCVQSWRSRPR